MSIFIQGVIVELNSKICVLLVVLNLIICYFVSSFLYNSSYSLTSPDFARQDILDNSSDAIIAPNFINKYPTTNSNILSNITSCEIFDSLTNSSLIPYGDITEVSYLSDGRFFNTTLWVDDFINFSNPNFPEGIDILELRNDKNLSLNEVANEYVPYKVKSFNLRNAEFITKNESTTLGKEHGLKFVVKTTRNDSSKTQEIYQWVIVEHNKRIYDFVFSSLSHRYEDLLDDVDKVMRSFVFIDSDDNKTYFKNNPTYEYQDFLKIAFEYPQHSKIEDFGNWTRVNFPTPTYKLISKSYQMLVDVKSTFDNGVDYIDRVWYDNSSQKWKESFYETKSLKSLQNKNNFENNENLRIIKEDEYTKFPTELLNKLLKQSFYVPLSMNLSYINFPTTYDVYFVTTSLYNTTKGLCNIIDTTSFTPIPPPKMNITLVPNSLDLRPRDNKSIEITIDPSTRLPYTIKLESNASDIIAYNFTSRNDSSIHKDILKTNINVAALNKEGLTYPKYYSLPITATLLIEPSHIDILTDYIIDDKLFSNTSSTTYLPIKISAPLTPIDFLSSAAEKIASPLGVIITTLALIVGGIMGTFKWFQSHKKKGSEIQDNG